MQSFFYKLIYSKTLLVKNTFAAYFDSQESIFGCSHPLQLTNFSRVGMKLDFIIIYYTMLKSFKMKIFFKSYSTPFFFLQSKRQKFGCSHPLVLNAFLSGPLSNVIRPNLEFFFAECCKK